ncbi:MAG TPA: hypothetical protein PK959_00640 [Candidatus Competibacteraceae bacterium]|nr:hypothetical protein [Candidatus Competibacteraceae bacterium]HSA47058.1 hypothetical protein [Candidatus Competibacteraceae bacterium]
MTRYSTAQAQRARHQLNREALKRSHRRGDLIRTQADPELDASASPLANSAETVEHSATTPCLRL